MLAYVGSGIRFTSRSYAIGFINGHGELLRVVRSSARPLKTEYLGSILSTREEEPSIKISVYDKRGSVAEAKQFGRRWSDIAEWFTMRKQPASDEFPVDAFVLI